MDFTVENAGTTIACREYAGPVVSSDAPALVCVHGACVDGVFFDAIARELACDYRVIAYDRRGCGESGDAADGRYDLAAPSRRPAGRYRAYWRSGKRARAQCRYVGGPGASPCKPRHNLACDFCMNPP